MNSEKKELFYGDVQMEFLILQKCSFEKFDAKAVCNLPGAVRGKWFSDYKHGVGDEKDVLQMSWKAYQIFVSSCREYYSLAVVQGYTIETTGKLSEASETRFYEAVDTLISAQWKKSFDKRIKGIKLNSPDEGLSYVAFGAVTECIIASFAQGKKLWEHPEVSWAV